MTRTARVVAAAFALALPGIAAAQPAPQPAPSAGVAPATTEDLRAELDQLKGLIAEQQIAAEAERMALLDMMTSQQTPQLDEPKLQIYGFMDAGLQSYLFPRKDDSAAGQSVRALFPTEQATFISGNTNIYFDARPVQGWRGLIETRLTLLPHGVYTYDRTGVLPRQQNKITDLTSPSGRDRVQIGALIMERAQIEYTFSSRLRVIAGYFVTPWGIWNLEHGTPTLISLMLPSFLVDEAVPQKLTGVQLTGNFVGPPWELGYHLHVSNGRSSTLFDLTDDKAIGGRVFVRYAGEDFAVSLGGSGYYGRTEDEDKVVTLQPDGTLTLRKELKFRYDDLVGGIDLAFDWAGLRVRGEAVVRKVDYRRNRREPTYGVLGGTVPDHTSQFAYITAAYRFGWLEPYGYVEVKETGASNAFLPDDARALSVGFNVYFSAATQLKVQYADIYFNNRSGERRPALITSRLVLAF